MDRVLLIASTACFFVGVLRTLLSVRAGVFRPGRFNFFAIAAGFVLQTVFLWMRGNAVGRCPLTNLFEVFIFMAWSLALIYMLVGAAYRLSLMGAFTAPLVFLIQTFALVAPIDRPAPPKIEVNAWLEFHASMSIVAYGAFALAGVAGLMYLLQERQLKRRQLHSIFHHLPPLTDLYSAITRLLWLGFALYTAGLVSGFFTGEPLPVIKMTAAILVWLLYAAILQGRQLFRMGPKHVAVMCVVAFTAAVSVLWGITFVSEAAPVIR
jgi:HemX protein